MKKRNIFGTIAIVAAVACCASCSTNTEKPYNVSPVVVSTRFNETNYVRFTYEDDETAYKLFIRKENSGIDVKELTSEKIFFALENPEYFPNLSGKLYKGKMVGLWFNTMVGTSSDGEAFTYDKCSINVEDFKINNKKDIEYILFSLPVESPYLCLNGAFGWTDDLVYYSDEVVIPYKTEITGINNVIPQTELEVKNVDNIKNPKKIEDVQNIK